jgi:tetratricopeptide (TPR) repeat protein
MVLGPWFFVRPSSLSLVRTEDGSARSGKLAFDQEEDYKGAAAKYEETIAICEGSRSDCTDPQLTYAYFFLGNSYDNQFSPARRGDATNDAMLTRAIDNYKKSASIERDPKIRKLAMEYLVAAYGPDKLDEPSQAVTLLRRMIELEPTEPGNYTYLSRIYEEHGWYEQAEHLLLTATEKRPGDPTVYVTLAAFYNRWGEFDKTMSALFTIAEHQPNNPEAFYRIATYYWGKAYRDFTVRDRRNSNTFAPASRRSTKPFRFVPTIWRRSCTRDSCYGCRRIWSKTRRASNC